MWAMENDEFLGEIEGWSRGAQFGDGVFETMPIINRQCKTLNLHAIRLEKSLAALKIPLPSNSLKSMLLESINTITLHSQMFDGVLKVMVTRGDSARGYGFDLNLLPKVTLLYSGLVEYPSHIYDSGVALQAVETLCSIQPQLAGLKHLNRLENVLAKNELLPSTFEGIMSNYLGNVIEGTMSNVFFENDDALYSPDLTLSGVEGIMRSLVLRYCGKQNIPLSITDIPRSELDEFDGAFISNSLIGVLPVSSIGKKKLTITPLIKNIVEAVRSGKIYE